MRNPTTTAGAVVLAVVGLFVLDFPIATDAPVDQLVFGAAVGGLTLLALGGWAIGRAPRASMWTAVVLTGFSALAAVPPIFLRRRRPGSASSRSSMSWLRSAASRSSTTHLPAAASDVPCPLRRARAWREADRRG